jgi:hypothetical protein
MNQVSSVRIPTQLPIIAMYSYAFEGIMASDAAVV